MNQFKVTLAILLLNLIAFSGVGFAQELDAPDNKPVIGAYDRGHLHQRQVPIAYPLVRESDVTWSRLVMRSINLKEKANLPLYYPIEPVADWASLADIIIGAISTYQDESNVFGVHSLTAYRDKYFEGYFESIESVQNILQYEITQTDAMGAPMQVTYPVNSESIKEYHLLEEWFFDKRRSQMDVRIIAMAPIFYKRRWDAVAKESVYDNTPTALCWLYFPEARYYFCHNYVYNIKNDSERRTFDDYFMKRRFSSYIIKVSNVYDRMINEYSLGLDALLEAENAKREIEEFEFDLWEY